MDLGDVIQDVVQRDLAANGKDNQLYYEEIWEDGKMTIKFGSKKFPEATITCSLDYHGLLSEESSLRCYFLSMAFNAAIHGMKRMNYKKGKKQNKNLN